MIDANKYLKKINDLIFKNVVFFVTFVVQK